MRNFCDEHYIGQTITSFSQSYAFTDITGRTIETNDQAALKLHYANKNSTSSKNFEEAYSITFTDSTSNHTNLGYLVNLLKTNVSTSKTILLF